MTDAAMIERPEIAGDVAAAGLRAFFRVSQAWGLGESACRVLLGQPSRATYYNWKRGRVRRISHDTVRRLSYVLGIYKALQILYADRDLADGWIARPNAAFGGATALDRMLAGDVTDLAFVRQHLDAARGG